MFKMDDWDNQTSSNMNGDAEPVGRSFMGRGRGFRTAPRGGGGGFNRDDNSGFRKPGDESGDGGFRGRRRDENGDGESGGFRGRRRDENGDGESGGFRGRRRDENGDGESGGFRGRRRDGEENGGAGGGELGPNGEEKKAPVTYVPPEPTEDENEMYNTGISSGINFDKYDSIPVKMTGENVVQPIKSFAESNLRKFLLDIVAKCGYAKPTPIQKHAIPNIMAGRDVMACAQTGSGKTAAFLLPIVNELLANPSEIEADPECAQPQVVILSPTRELAIQIWEESRKFVHGSRLQSRVVYGGVAVGHQIRQVLGGTDILVATPGRMLDFLDRGKIIFSSVRFVVLDEADRMLDMGFKTGIDKMMAHSSMVPKGERQTLMFSATFPGEIQRMASNYLQNYIFITVGTVGGACSDVEQRFLEVPRFEKKKTLLRLLKEIGSERTVVFVETKKQADFVSVILSENGIPATSIHGDREQRQREEAINDFKTGRMHILVATAVASRGLDIKGIAHVINYDLPKEVDEYVHRIGRTGRVGNRGIATSFYDPDKNSDVASALVALLKQSDQQVPDFLLAASGGDCGISAGGAYGGEDFRNDASAPAPVTENEEW